MYNKVVFTNCETNLPMPQKPGLQQQRSRRKSAIQKIYDGCGNFNDGSVASGAPAKCPTIYRLKH